MTGKESSSKEPQEMGNAKPRYFVSKKNKDGTYRYYWQPKQSLVDTGEWETRRLAEPWDRTKFPSQLAQAVAEAEDFNTDLDKWYAGEADDAMPPDSMKALIRLFQADEVFTEKSDRTQSDYIKYCDIIETWCGDTPVGAITKKACLAGVRAWRDSRGFTTARHLKGMGSRLMKFAIAEAWRDDNPFAEIELRRRRADKHPEDHPADKFIWPERAVTLFVEAADRLGYHSVGTGILMNNWTGQRPNDLRLMPKPIVGRDVIRLKQTKRQKTVSLPVGVVPHIITRVREELSRQKSLSVTATTMIVNEQTGLPYGAGNFNRVYRLIRDKVASKQPVVPFQPGSDEMVETGGLLMKWLRDTALIRLLEAGASKEEACAITGHSLKAADGIIEFYYHRTEKLATVAFLRRLEGQDAES